MTSKDSISSIEEPKVIIRIKKVNHWSHFNNNGHVDQGGSLTEKDTAVYVKDVEKVNLNIEKINQLKKHKAYDDFKKNN